MNFRSAGLVAAISVVMVAGCSVAAIAAVTPAAAPSAPAKAAAVPEVRGVSPAAGGTAGGAAVTVTGSGFRHVSRVLFGSAAGTRVHVVSADKLIAIAPKHAAGTVNVRVVTGSGTAARTSAARAADRYTYDPPLKIATAVLPKGIAGLTYQAVLTAVGGTRPYVWTAPGLPRGLSVTAGGIISGYPAAAGTRMVRVKVTDAEHVARTAVLTLEVPSALPAGCAARACAQLSRDGRTVHIPAADVGAVTRDPTSQSVTQVVLSGITVSAGDVLVLAPGGGVPSGLIAVARTVTPGAGEIAAVTLTPANPADAYDSGTVQALSGSAARRTAMTPTATRAADTALDCSGNVASSLHGLSITHTLTPSLTAIWKHPFFGGGGIYVGSGGLSLFQFDLDGTITLNMGIAVSGAATCTLTLPELEADVPAGDLGAVIFTTQPSLSFTVTGKIDIRSTITLSCGAEYRWETGTQTRIAYCLPSTTPLGLSADSGLDATLRGTLDASVTLDDIAGITGDIWAQAHVGYHPAAHPVAELDASAGYDLGACLACFWDGSPARVTIGSGTFFSKTIATYDRLPESPGLSVSPGAGPRGTAVTITGTAFQPGETVRATDATGPPVTICSGTATADGRFTCRGQVPGTASYAPQQIAARGLTSAGQAAAIFDVISGSHYAYVSDATAVTSVNTATNKSGTPISVLHPRCLAVTPDGAKAYVTNNSDTVTPINLATNSAGNPITIGPDLPPAFDIAITPDGATAYVTNGANDTVTPINLATNTAGKPIRIAGPSGSVIFGIAITPDGSTAYVTDENGATVTPINLATNTVGKPIPLGTYTDEIAITPDGSTAYVTDISGTVTPVNLATKSARTPIQIVPGGGGDLGGIAITPDGAAAYVTNVSDTGSGTVTPIDLATNTAGRPIPAGSNPWGLAITPGGTEAYVTNGYSGHTVTPINLATNTAGKPIPGGSAPNGIATTYDGSCI